MDDKSTQLKVQPIDLKGYRASSFFACTDNKDVKSQKLEEVMPDKVLARMPFSDVPKIILDYAGWSDAAERLLDPNTVRSNQSLRIFGQDDPFPALAAQHIAWGNVDEALEIIASNPYVLTVETQATDHIGTVSGMLLTIILRLGDTYISDVRGEIFPRVLMRALKKYFGADEVETQLTQAQKMMEEDEKEKEKEEANDEKALTAMWDVVTKVDAKINVKGLEENPAVAIAIATFREQLKKPGNAKILEMARKWFVRDCKAFGGYDKPKNNFVVNQIIGSIQRHRLRVCDLQVFYVKQDGFDRSSRVQRSDVRLKLGIDTVRADAGVDVSRLGFNRYLDLCEGLMDRCQPASMGHGHRDWVAHSATILRELWWSKKNNVEELMQCESMPAVLSDLPQGAVDEAILDCLCPEEADKSLDPGRSKWAQRWCLFGQSHPLSDLAARAADHIAEGDLKKALKIVKMYPDILTLQTEATDHIDTVSGTLLVITARLGDTYIRNAKDEILPQILIAALEKHHGLHEVEAQLTKARQMREEDEKKKSKEEVNDEEALKTLSGAVKKADQKDLEEESVATALEAFREQLKKPGNTKILNKAWKWWLSEEYAAFGGDGSLKNNFIANQIIGLIQRHRLRICDLQVFSLGLVSAVKGVISANPRVDIHFELGLRMFHEDEDFDLGFNGHLDIAKGAMMLSKQSSPQSAADFAIHHMELFVMQKDQRWELVQRPSSHPGLKPKM